MQDVTSVSPEFSLSKIAGLSESWRRAGLHEHPGEAYEHTYTRHVILRGEVWHNCGTLRLRRTVEGESHRISVHASFPAADGLSHFTELALVCGPAVLSAPRSWELKTRLAEHAEEPGRYRYSFRGELDDSRLRLHHGGRTREQAVEMPVCGEWCLFDVVQRLPLDLFEPTRLTFLKHYETALPGCVLRGLTAATVQCSEGPETLFGYQLTGPGTVPVQYWVDANQRLLFVVSGLEAHVLQAARAVPGGEAAE